MALLRIRLRWQRTVLLHPCLEEPLELRVTYHPQPAVEGRPIVVDLEARGIRGFDRSVPAHAMQDGVGRVVIEATADHLLREAIEQLVDVRVGRVERQELGLEIAHMRILSEQYDQGFASHSDTHV